MRPPRTSIDGVSTAKTKVVKRTRREKERQRSESPPPPSVTNTIHGIGRPKFSSSVSAPVRPIRSEERTASTSKEPGRVGVLERERMPYSMSLNSSTDYPFLVRHFDYSPKVMRQRQNHLQMYHQHKENAKVRSTFSYQRLDVTPQFMQSSTPQSPVFLSLFRTMWSNYSRQMRTSLPNPMAVPLQNGGPASSLSRKFSKFYPLVRKLLRRSLNLQRFVQRK